MTLPPPVELSHLLDPNIPEETRDLALRNALRIPSNPPQSTPLNSLLPSIAGSQNDPLISAFITNFIQNLPVSMHPTDLFIMTLTAISISCPLSTFPSLKILIDKIVVGNTTTSATRIITSMSSALENAPLLEEINANANIKIDATSNKLRLLELISSTCFSQSLHPPTLTILSTLESLLTSSDLLSVPVTFEFIVSLAEEYKTRNDDDLKGWIVNTLTSIFNGQAFANFSEEEDSMLLVPFASMVVDVELCGLGIASSDFLDALIEKVQVNCVGDGKSEAYTISIYLNLLQCRINRDSEYVSGLTKTKIPQTAFFLSDKTSEVKSLIEEIKERNWKSESFRAMFNSINN